MGPSPRARSARPAAGPGLVVGDEVVGREVVVDERRLVRRRDDPVRSSTGPSRSGLRRFARVDIGLERLPLGGDSGRDRPVSLSRATSTASASADELAVSVRISSRSVTLDVPIPDKPAGDERRAVILGKLAPVVDRDARQYEAPGLPASPSVLSAHSSRHSSR